MLPLEKLEGVVGLGDSVYLPSHCGGFSTAHKDCMEVASMSGDQCSLISIKASELASVADSGRCETERVL